MTKYVTKSKCKRKKVAVMPNSLMKEGSRRVYNCDNKNKLKNWIFNSRLCEIAINLHNVLE